MLANDLDVWVCKGCLKSLLLEVVYEASGFLAAGYILNLLRSPPKVLLGLNPLGFSEPY